MAYEVAHVIWNHTISLTLRCSLFAVRSCKIDSLEWVRLHIVTVQFMEAIWKQITTEIKIEKINYGSATNNQRNTPPDPSHRHIRVR